jgi:CHRD domain
MKSNIATGQKNGESTMKFFTFILFAPVLLALGAGMPVLGAEVAVRLTGDQEVPPVTSAATGVGTLVIKNDHSVSGSIKTTGIEGTMAHIHLAEPGKNGPPIITLTKTADNTWSVPEGSKLTDDQFKSFKEGNLYVNVHSAEHKGGEIRTQLKP